MGVCQHQGLRQVQLYSECDEPLLCTVVQVALDLAPLTIRGGRYAGARRAQLAERLLDSAGEVLLVEGDEGEGGDRLDELAVLAERAVVYEPGHSAVASTHLGQDKARLGCGRLDAPPVRVDPVHTGALDPVQEVERGVPERGRQRRAELR